MPCSLSLKDWADISVIIGVVVGVGALIYNAITTRQTARAHDFTTFRQLSNDLSDAWARYLSEQDVTKEEYRFAELLNEIESACFLLNNKIVSRGIENVLRNRILESVVLVITHEKQLRMFADLAEKDNVFVEMERFAKRHEDLYRKHWPKRQQDSAHLASDTEQP